MQLRAILFILYIFGGSAALSAQWVENWKLENLVAEQETLYHATSAEGITYVVESKYLTSGLSITRYDQNREMISDPVFSLFALGETFRPVFHQFDEFGNLYIAGREVDGSQNDFPSVVKFNPSGEFQWYFRGNYLERDNPALGLGVDASGNVAFSYKESDTLNAGDLAVRRFDPEGNEIFSKNYTDHYYFGEDPFTIPFHDDGSFLLSMYAPDSNGTMKNHFIRLDVDGNEVLNTTRPAENGIDLNKFLIHANGTYSYTHYFFIDRLDEAGELVWSKPTQTITHKMIPGPNGEIFLIGMPDTNFYQCRMMILGGDGERQLVLRYLGNNGPFRAAGVDAIQGPDGYFYVLGVYSENFPGGLTDPWEQAILLRYNPNARFFDRSQLIPLYETEFHGLSLQEHNNRFYLSGIVNKDSTTTAFTRQLAPWECTGYTNGLCLFPNPTRAFININPVLQQVGPYTLILFDLKGKKVLSQSGTYEGVPIQVAVQHLRQGTYLYRLETEEGIHEGKVVRAN